MQPWPVAYGAFAPRLALSAVVDGVHSALLLQNANSRSEDMSGRVRAIVAGATGYSGRDLIRLLLSHPQIDLVGALASRSAETMALAAIHPQLTGLTKLDCQPFDEATIERLKPGLIFLATPNEFSHEVAPALLEAGATVVDISGAFRLRDAAAYPRFYGC